MHLYLSVGNDGRILIPKVMRDALEIKSNTKVIASIEDNVIHISTVHSALEQARSLVKKHCKSNSSIVDKFIEMRKKEAEVEELKFFTSKDKAK